jgi:hypothetical protein
MEVTEPTNEDLLATVRTRLQESLLDTQPRRGTFTTSEAQRALDTLAVRLEAAEQEIDQLRQACAISFSDKDAGILTLIKRAEAAEREVKRLRDLCERIADVLPDPMHPAFPREFVDKQVGGVVLLRAALAEEK